MEFEKILNDLLQGNPSTILVTQVFIVVFGTLLIDFIQKRAVRRLQGRIEKTRILWDDALYFAARRPLSVLIWLLGLSFAADIVGSETDAAIFDAVSPIRNLGVIATFSWFLFRFIHAMERNVVLKAERKGAEIDRTTVYAIGKLLRLSVLITTGNWISILCPDFIESNKR